MIWRKFHLFEVIWSGWDGRDKIGGGDDEEGYILETPSKNIL